MNWGGFLNWLRFLFRNDAGSEAEPITPAPPVPSPAPVPPPPPAPPVSAPRPEFNPPVAPPVAPPPEATPAPERPPFIPPPEETLPQEGVKLGFGRLWDNHPNISHTEMQPCRRPDGVPNFGNQCAIRMGVCLSLSDLLSNYDGVQCWFGHRGQGHTLRARELAAWLRKNRATFGEAEIKKNVTFEEYANRTGIVYCQNFWGENNQGDHIDLWDGTGQFMARGSFAWEGPAMASGGLDYFERSEEVWFWPVH